MKNPAPPAREEPGFSSGKAPTYRLSHTYWINVLVSTDLPSHPTPVNKRDKHTNHSQHKEQYSMSSVRFIWWAGRKRVIDSRNYIIDSTDQKEYRQNNSSKENRSLIHFFSFSKAIF